MPHMAADGGSRNNDALLCLLYRTLSITRSRSQAHAVPGSFPRSTVNAIRDALLDEYSGITTDHDAVAMEASDRMGGAFCLPFALPIRRWVPETLPPSDQVPHLHRDRAQGRAVREKGGLNLDVVGLFDKGGYLGCGQRVEADLSQQSIRCYKLRGDIRNAAKPAENLPGNCVDIGGGLGSCGSGRCFRLSGRDSFRRCGQRRGLPVARPTRRHAAG